MEKFGRYQVVEWLGGGWHGVRGEAREGSDRTVSKPK